MVRTQLQIDEDTYDALRETAHRQKKSMSAVARDILKLHLVAQITEEQQETLDIKQKYPWIASGKSAEHDISVRHDEYLAEAYDDLP